MTDDLLADALAAAPYEPRRGWRADAACLPPTGPTTANTAVYFVSVGNHVNPAVAVCRTCPVRLDCAYEGATETHGVFGGLTPRGRREFRKQLRARGIDLGRLRTRPVPPGGNPVCREAQGTSAGAKRHQRYRKNVDPDHRPCEACRLWRNADERDRRRRRGAT